VDVEWESIIEDTVQVCAKNKVTNTPMPETSLCLNCIHGTWVADGAHQTSTQSPLTFKHLFHLGTKVCIPVWKKSLPSVCSLEAEQLPSRGVLFKAPQELEISGPHAANRTCDWLWCCDWEPIRHITCSPHLAP
jgi:hypothetical protein